MSRPWYVEGFGRHYLELYAHRDEEEAVRAVDLLGRLGRDLSGSTLLDLGCGAGRHLQELERRGAVALGLDLSRPLLDEARRRLAPHIALLRGDMRRLPVRDAVLDGVLSMFTSFGYFHADEENWRVLAEVARVLRPGGFFLFDFLNRRQVETSLERESRRESEHWTAEESRRIADGRVLKTVCLTERGGGQILRYEESVRLFSPEQIRREARACGLVEEAAWGSYGADSFDVSTSARFILLARKEGL